MNLRRQLIIFLIVLSFIFTGAWYLYQSETVTMYTVATFWVISVLFLTGAGNYLLYLWLNRRLHWDDSALKRMTYQLSMSGMYTLICVNLSYYFFKSYLTEVPPDYQQMALLNVYAILIIIPVFSIFFGIYFLAKWKKATLEVEDAKKEIIKAELHALKNHIDPHFLFNNLNILSALIEPENEDAQSFLEKFSEVYRYVLKHKDVEVTKLSSELAFLEAYIFLINTRFEQQVDFDIRIDEKVKEKYVPTLAIQMLVENALKHNKFSKSNKLKVEILAGKESLTVRNNIMSKPGDSPEKHEGSGLKNIEKRYELLSSKKPEIRISKGRFSVEIPLLNMH